MAADQPPAKPEQRRSSRFPVVVPIEVKWKEPSGEIVKEAAQAKEVNAQGGLLDMKIYPWVGGDLELTNLLSGQSHEISSETAEIEEFFQALKSLHQRIADLLRNREA